MRDEIFTNRPLIDITEPYIYGSAMSITVHGLYVYSMGLGPKGHVHECKLKAFRFFKSFMNFTHNVNN